MGRPKGSPNKLTLESVTIAQRKKCNFMEMLCDVAKGDWKALGYSSEYETKWVRGEEIETLRIPMDLRLKAIVEGAQYCHPKRKSIEIIEVSDPNANRPLRHLPNEELDKL